MKLKGLVVRNEDISSMQFWPQVIHDTGAVRPSGFDIILKSGNTLHVIADEDAFNKAVESLMIE